MAVTVIVCTHAYEYRHVHAMTHRWRSEDNFPVCIAGTDLILPVSIEGTNLKASGLRSNHFYPLSLLTSLTVVPTVVHSLSQWQLSRKSCLSHGSRAMQDGSQTSQGYPLPATPRQIVQPLRSLLHPIRDRTQVQIPSRSSLCFPQGG